MIDQFEIITVSCDQKSQSLSAWSAVSHCFQLRDALHIALNRIQNGLRNKHHERRDAPPCCCLPGFIEEKW